MKYDFSIQVKAMWKSLRDSVVRYYKWWTKEIFERKNGDVAEASFIVLYSFAWVVGTIFLFTASPSGEAVMTTILCLFFWPIPILMIASVVAFLYRGWNWFNKWRIDACEKYLKEEKGDEA